MTDQTPEARLAAALAAYERQADPDYVDEAMAEGVLAADPTLAADLALAASVRKMPYPMGLLQSLGGWLVIDSRDGKTLGFSDRDPALAIEGCYIEMTGDDMTIKAAKEATTEKEIR